VTEQNYWVVENCRYCKSPIPLAQYDSNYYYRLADSFTVRHDEQNADTACHARGVYTYADLTRQDLELIPGLKRNLDFAERILPFRSA
jgi:hypothetical protein